MTVHKLLSLLFEHIEAGEIETFEVYSDVILIYNHEESNYSTIKLNQDLLTQYNKIFNYE